MSIDHLQHVNIRCADAKRSRDFYVDLLGLVDGDRPPFTSVGYWLYVGELPAIHLVQRSARHGPAVTGSGTIDHVAFRSHDLAGMRARLDAAGVDYKVEVVPRDGTIQLFLFDPDGVRIELNFEASS